MPMIEEVYNLFISMLLEATMIFLGNVIHKRWHTWIGRRTGGDKVIAGTSGDASRMRGRKGQREWCGR